MKNVAKYRKGGKTPQIENLEALASLPWVSCIYADGVYFLTEYGFQMYWKNKNFTKAN